MLNNWIYISSGVIFIIGFYMMMTENLHIRRLIGLSIFQNSILILYVSLGKKRNSIIPVDICDKYKEITNCYESLSNPIPHVLMLTAIVVGFATISVAMSFIKRIERKN